MPGHDIIKTPEQIEGIRESGKVTIAVLDYVAENIRAGISTEQINKWVDDKTRELGGIPAPLGYELPEERLYFHQRRGLPRYSE